MVVSYGMERVGLYGARLSEKFPYASLVGRNGPTRAFPGRPIKPRLIVEKCPGSG